jgi:hypothetical protein
VEKGAIMSDMTVKIERVQDKRNRFKVYIDGEMDSWNMIQTAVHLLQQAQSLTLFLDEKGNRIDRVMGTVTGRVTSKKEE